MAVLFGGFPCFPWLNCHTKAFATQILFLLTLCNAAQFVAILLHLTSDPDSIQAEAETHSNQVSIGNNHSGPHTKENWEVEEVKGDMLSYSNIWFVIAPGLYSVMVTPDYTVDPDGFIQINSQNSRIRALGVLALIVTVALVSTFKHAFEASTMYPAVTHENFQPQDSTENRIYCELTSGLAWSRLARGERDAAYVYACLPAYWAMKVDWLTARVSVYTIAFLAWGFPEAIYVLWSDKSPYWHALAQTVFVGLLGACILMDVVATVTSTTESAMDLAIDSAIMSSSFLLPPWTLLMCFNKTANKVAWEVWYDERLNLPHRIVLVALNVGMGYYAWTYEDSKYRIAHMGWHFFSGVAALGSLTLTVDWEGRLRAEMAAEADAEMEPLAAKAPAGQSRKPIVI